MSITMVYQHILVSIGNGVNTISQSITYHCKVKQASMAQ